MRDVRKTALVLAGALPSPTHRGGLRLLAL